MSRLCSSKWRNVGLVITACAVIALTIVLSANAKDSSGPVSAASSSGVGVASKSVGQVAESAAFIARPATSAASDRRHVLGGGGPDYSTGFENPPFTPGYIDGQDGWGAFAASTVEAHIDTDSPQAGLQQLEIASDPAVAINTNIGAFSPMLGEFPICPGYKATISMQLMISAFNDATYSVQPQSPSQGLLTTNVRFIRPMANPNIEVLDDGDNDGDLEYINTGTNWVAGMYRNLTIVVDPCLNRFTVSYGGVLIYTSDTLPASNTAEEVVLIKSNSSPGTSVARFDAFSHTTEICTPAACSDPAAGGCFDVNATGGCENCVCCQAVCQLDSFCCTGVWDDVCASLADGLPDTVCPPPYVCNAMSPHPPGGNDCCTTPTMVTGDATLAYDTTNAETDGPDDGNNPCMSAMSDSNIWKDVWYLYHATCCGQLTISNCFAPSNFDSKIAAYDVTTPNLDDLCDIIEANLIECNEDCEASAPYRSELTIGVLGGTDYMIRLGGYSGTADEAGAEFGAGNVTFDLQCAGAFADGCSGALTATNGETVYCNSGATTDGPAHDSCNQFPADPDSNNQVNNDIWFNYTATATGGLQLDTCGNADYDTKIAVYNTCTCAELSDATLIGCNDDGFCPGFTSNLIVNVVQNQCYKIRVGGFNEAASGVGTLSITPACTVQDPAGAVQEVEQCGEDTNGGCNGPLGGDPSEFQNVDAGVTIAGEAWADGGTRDTDWFLIDSADLAAADADSDGMAKICYAIQSEIPLGVGIDPVEDSAFAHCTSQFVYGVVTSSACSVSDMGSYDGVDDPPSSVEVTGDYALLVLPIDNDVPGGLFDDYPCDNKLGNSYNTCVEVVDDGADCPSAEACLGLGPACPTCTGDFNGNGTVNAADLALLLGAWGPGCSQANGCCMDINNSGSVNAADLALLLGNWGPC